MSHASEVQRSAANTYKRANQAASEQVRTLTAEVDNRRLLLDLATATAPVPPSDIPRLFLDAYPRAAGRRSRPSKGSSPTMVASEVPRPTLNGDPVPPIVGIRLDGSNSAVITETDGGLLDGDPEFDRAVGPTKACARRSSPTTIRMPTWSPCSGGSEPTPPWRPPCRWHLAQTGAPDPNGAAASR